VRSARAATPSPRQVQDPDRLVAAEVDDIDGNAALSGPEGQRRGAAEHLERVQVHPAVQRYRRAARGSCRRRLGGDTRPRIGAACRSSGPCAAGLLCASPAGREVVRARGLVRWVIEPSRSTLTCAAVGSRPEPRPPPAALPGHLPVSGRMSRSVGGARKRWPPQSGTAVAPRSPHRRHSAGRLGDARRGVASGKRGRQLPGSGALNSTCPQLAQRYATIPRRPVATPLTWNGGSSPGTHSKGELPWLPISLIVPCTIAPEHLGHDRCSVMSYPFRLLAQRHAFPHPAMTTRWQVGQMAACDQPTRGGRS